MTRRSLCRAELVTTVADAVGNASDGIATFPLPNRSRSLNPSLDIDHGLEGVVPVSASITRRPH